MELVAVVEAVGQAVREIGATIEALLYLKPLPFLFTTLTGLAESWYSGIREGSYDIAVSPQEKGQKMPEDEEYPRKEDDDDSNIDKEKMAHARGRKRVPSPLAQASPGGRKRKKKKEDGRNTSTKPGNQENHNPQFRKSSKETQATVLHTPPHSNPNNLK
ncbi:hypothetical protein L873DRAFT_1792650 [Choiromyces venosus 120613-1]|uniref:Uncharacterized protein n=1 Tax=Choiromyces venosus 120613-1 TaxID=1336337 RepID=A0A3N4JC80_9PEZI|nr:hypothetical protein L873DRAFT_1792650 [Choiromyces venosus 120613-1]